MQMQARITNTKVDIAFATSLAGVKKYLIIQIALHLLQCITMISMIFIDIYVYQHKNQQVLSFFVTASCITFLNLIAKLGHLVFRLNDSTTIMSIATQLNHVVEEQPQSERLNGDNQNNNNYMVSDKIYNSQNMMTIEQAAPAIRNSLEGALSNMIKTLALSRDPLNRCTISIGSSISFVLFIYGIVVLASVPEMETPQIIVMSLFLVSQFLVQIQMFLCLIFIALLPLLCFLFCVYACCCKQGNKPAQLPAARQATVQIIQQSDGEPCSICFQNIMLNEQVVTLPCSDKHIFHQNCISAWTAVKPTCPMCRHDLTQ